MVRIGDHGTPSPGDAAGCSTPFLQDNQQRPAGKRNTRGEKKEEISSFLSFFSPTLSIQDSIYLLSPPSVISPDKQQSEKLIDVFICTIIKCVYRARTVEGNFI